MLTDFLLDVAKFKVMSREKNCLWFVFLIVFCLPWFVATLIVWLYTAIYDSTAGETSGETGSNGSQSAGTTASMVIAIVHICSGFLYVMYALLAILFIGCAGRSSLCSFCCIVVGIPLFAAIPLVEGVVLLWGTLSRHSAGTSRTVGLVAAVTCFLSTVFCFIVTLVALICGSRGKGRHHRFPIPLAYLPFLKDFEEYEEEHDGSSKYTNDYPPPLRSLRDANSSTSNGRKSKNSDFSKNNGTKTRSGSNDSTKRKNSTSSTTNPGKNATPSSVTSTSIPRSDGKVTDQSRYSTSGAANPRNNERSYSSSNQSRPNQRTTSVSSMSSNKRKDRGRTESVASDTGSVFSKQANYKGKDSRSKGRSVSITSVVK